MDKIEGVRNQFDKFNIDSLLVMKQENIRYLTNFTGSSGAVLISKTAAIFITDFRYAKQAEEQVNGYDVKITGGSNTLISSIVKKVDSLGVKGLGFESSYLTYDTFTAFREKIKIDFISTQSIVEKLRQIKSESEVESLRRGANIADNSFERILKFVRPGLTESEVANELEHDMRKGGATSNSSDTLIVASGYRSSLPHGKASDKIIEQGDMITFDFGALYEGYRSDMTRTISIGEPTDQMKEIYDIVLEALMLCKKQIKHGMPAREVDSIVRDFITSHGYGENFGHGTGHGIGLEIHEDPFFSTTSTQTVEEGMVVTIEPGIYLPNIGGVRIEDDVLIKKDGIEVLTKSPKHLIKL